MEVSRKRRNEDIEHSYFHSKRLNNNIGNFQNNSKIIFTQNNINKYDKEINNLKKIISSLVEQINFQNKKICVLEEKIISEKESENICSMINMYKNHQIENDSKVKEKQLDYSYIS